MVLRILVSVPGKGKYETNVYEYKQLLETMQFSDEEIMEKIKKAVEYQRQQIIDLGFSEEEATAKINELIKKELGE